MYKSIFKPTHLTVLISLILIFSPRPGDQVSSWLSSRQPSAPGSRAALPAVPRRSRPIPNAAASWVVDANLLERPLCLGDRRAAAAPTRGPWRHWRGRALRRAGGRAAWPGRWCKSAARRPSRQVCRFFFLETVLISYHGVHLSLAMEVSDLFFPL